MNAADKNTHQGIFGVTGSSSVDSSRIIYTPSVFARTSLFHLQEAGTLQALRPHTNRRNGLDSFLFFVVVSGSGTLQYNGKDYELHPGDCVFIDCRKSYAHSTGDDLWKLQWVHFCGSNMAQIYEKYRSRGGMPVFHPREAGRYSKNLEELSHIAGSLSYVRDMEIHAKLSELLVFLMQDAWGEKKGESESERYVSSYSKAADIQKVKDYIDLHFAEKISLDDLASLFYINKFYLVKLFKNRYGTTVNDYLTACRVTKAKQLLRFTDKTIEEISCECGLTSAAYMSRIFKKVEDISPSSYRKQW